MICEYHDRNGMTGTGQVELKDCGRLIESAHDSARKAMCETEKDHVLYAIKLYSELGIEKLMMFNCLQLTGGELDEFILCYPVSMIYALHRNTCKLGCRKALERKRSRCIRPITLKAANAFVNEYHRHHHGTVGCKFSVGLFEGDEMVGAAVCGRPVSRRLDNGEICEINRLCTQGGANACSMLYGACCRIAKEMGYKKIITYILKSESGVTLRASNFTCEGIAGGTHWTGRRDKKQDIPYELKTRWSRVLNP